MKQVPSVDIVLPYYSPVERAWPSISSVLAQTRRDWRLVVVDDAYPENGVRDRLHALGDSRIHYTRNERNIGLARNFNRCLEMVEAPYFVMLGDDDLMHPRYLESVLERITAHPDADIVQPGVRVIDGSGAPALPMADRIKSMLRPRGGLEGIALTGEALAESLIRADWAYFPSLVWRTGSARAHGFREEYEVALDYGLLLDIALDGGTMIVYDDIVFDYRRHRASASSTTAASGLRFAQERAFALEYAEKFARRGWSRAARIGRRRLISRAHAASEAAAALLGGEVRRAMTLAGLAIR
ncbi:glycosyltransferase family 2 protein [Microbacterium sp. EF45047]|uniref:glycosyltransferase family 2 protein n=1 Tax=Microbacterium sp. EF45047 TaxID=2809708 RepID=UPI0023492B3F|nr:glycosyltransferase family 2 protein [Microbacterium sp. EF45047]WCM56351.1 glycosyltransferase family 2 protein [Microbacterium sp. EF45047]